MNDTAYPSLVRALTAVRTAAPHATVLLLGYLDILPASGGCFPQMPVAAGDVPYLDNVQTTLNNAVSRAAKVTGATYVDVSTISAISAGHDACQAVGTRWVEPVVGGENPVIVHPNALGRPRWPTRC